ncbi:MAG: hypothetical protein PIR02_01960 [Microbacterium enclense]
MSEASPPTRRARKAVEGESVPSALDEVAEQSSAHGDAEDGRLATAQLEMAAFGDHLVPYVPPAPKPPRSLAPWALLLAIVALASSFFWGWLLPLSVVAAILAIVSLRRPHDGRRAAAWALSLALVSGLFSAGWLVWGFSQLPVG